MKKELCEIGKIIDNNQPHGTNLHFSCLVNGSANMDDENEQIAFSILQYIYDSGFDISSWHVDQIAVSNIYSFTDGKEGWFDLEVDEETGAVKPYASVMTEMRCPGYINLVPVQSIEEAIKLSTEWMRACNEELGLNQY